MPGKDSSASIAEPWPKRRGLGLVIAGVVVAVGFGLFLLLSPSRGGTMAPLWIGVAWGVIMLVIGLVRLARHRPPAGEEHRQDEA